MHIKNIIISFSIMLLLSTFISSKSTKQFDFSKTESLPNSININDSLYCDQTEISNIDWMEYMFWNKRIFGEESNEYLSSLPDTSVWLEHECCVNDYYDYYLNHPVFRNYPVVGISQLQAEVYSKWRSDRVFEYYLVKNEILEYDTIQTSENYFTIEKFFNGDFKLKVADIIVSHYPEFRLPSYKERLLILEYSDSIDRAYFAKCKFKKCKECKGKFPEMWTDIQICEKDLFKESPTRAVEVNCTDEKGSQLFNLRGNVREWISAPNIAVGGGWIDKREKILQSEIMITKGVNAYTGFRNVCVWRKYQN
jgi:hypothetical protein